MWKRSGGLPPHLRRRPQRRNYRQRTCPTIYTLAAQLPNRTGCSQTPGELESHNLRQMLPGSDQVHRFGRYSSKRNAVLVGNHRPPPIAGGPLLRAFFDTIPSNVHRIDSQAVILLLGNNRPFVMLHLAAIGLDSKYGSAPAAARARSKEPPGGKRGSTYRSYDPIIGKALPQTLL
jgi:hypothetical protein